MKNTFRLPVLMILLFLFGFNKIAIAQWDELPRQLVQNYLYGVSFIDANSGYAVGDYGTILKTINGGQNWSLQVSGVKENLRSVYFINVNTGYAVGLGTILKTTDAGITWKAPNSSPDLYKKSLRSVYFVDANIGFIVGDDGIILKTIDAGSNWVAQSSGISAGLLSVRFFDANTGYAVGNGVILKTTNGGASWTVQNTGQKLFNKPLNSVCFVDINTTYVVGDYSTILKTSDGGVTWTNQKIQAGGLSGSFKAVHFTDANTGHIFGENDSNDGAINKTTDGGTNWYGERKGDHTLNACSFLDADNAFVVGSGGTVFSTNNGGGSIIPGSENKSVKISSIISTGSEIYVGTELGVCRITDNGNTWTEINFGMSTLSLGVGGSTISAWGYYPARFVSENNGKDWNQNITTPDAKPYSESDFTFTEVGWIKKSKDFKNVSGELIYAINGNTVCVGSWDDKGGLVFLSLNGGDKYKKIYPGIWGRTLGGLMISGTDILFGTSSGITLSGDNGKTWKIVTNESISSLIKVGTTLFAATLNSTIISSSDNGQTWKTINNGSAPGGMKLAALGNTLFGVSNEYLYASQDNGVSWKRNAGRKTIVKDSIQKKKTIADNIEANIEAKRIYDADSTKRRERAEIEKNRAEIEKLQNIIQNYFCGVAEVSYANYEAAVLKYSEAITARPHFIEALRGRKNCYLKLNQTDKAMADSVAIKKFSGTDVSNDKVVFSKQLKTHGAYVQASLATSAHLECYYKDDKAWFALGKSNLDKYKQNLSYKTVETELLNSAITNLTTAIDYNDKVAKYFIRRGEAHTLDKNFNAAGQDFYKARQIDPKCQNECYEASFFECPECKGEKRFYVAALDKKDQKVTKERVDNFTPIHTAVIITTTTGVAGYVNCNRCNGKGKVQQ